MAKELYGEYSIVSNKTVRRNEKKFYRWWNKNKDIKGTEMIQTNRGWFLDRHNIDEASVALWFKQTGLDRDWFKKKAAEKAKY